MSLTSYRAAPPRDPEDNSIMPELIPDASAFVKNVKIYPAQENGQSVSGLQAAAGNQPGFSWRRALSMN